MDVTGAVIIEDGDINCKVSESLISGGHTRSLPTHCISQSKAQAQLRFKGLEKEIPLQKWREWQCHTAERGTNWERKNLQPLNNLTHSESSSIICICLTSNINTRGKLSKNICGLHQFFQGPFLISSYSNYYLL